MRWPSGPNKAVVLAALFAIIGFVLLPVCPLPSLDGSGTGCHSESDSDSPDMPDQQQSCCFAVTHQQPGIVSSGPVISLVAVATLSEISRPLALQPFSILELTKLATGFSPPLPTILRV
ncbi:MAG TPA: hypothetical protein VHA33_22890 [Candidatus Angelobacter sp.]|jgi:hypothetical protein|nr:hypothetical protein [Candidatus Angelobacter sp.]